MARMLDVIGIVQRYPWGDVDAIPRLLGREPDASPQAEWWLGTHPSGPSTVSTTTGDDRPLVEVSGPLPYLVKVLAAAMPLSLQVHPDEPTAAAGFAREEALGIDRLADERTYRDPYAKTEILCALTRFEALCGFRPVADTIAMLRRLGTPATDELARRLATFGIGPVVREVLLDPPADIDEVVAACRDHQGEHVALTQWIDRLGRDHPGDPALVVALMLHHVVLERGDAVYLTPGTLHAYLHGVGVEVMGSSDNVVRAGFTSKHIDRQELLRIVAPGRRRSAGGDDRVGTRSVHLRDAGRAVPPHPRRARRRRRAHGRRTGDPCRHRRRSGCAQRRRGPLRRSRRALHA